MDTADKVADLRILQTSALAEEIDVEAQFEGYPARRSISSPGLACLQGSIIIRAYQFLSPLQFQKSYLEVDQILCRKQRNFHPRRTFSQDNHENLAYEAFE